MTISPTDRTKLNNLSPNLVPNQVAVSALRLAVFQEIYEYLDQIIADLNNAQGIGSVTSAKLGDGSVITVKIADSAVTGPKILDGSVVEMKIANGAVTTVKLADLVITTTKLVDHAVTSEKIAAGSVGSSQLDPMLLQNFGDIAVQAKFIQVDAQLAETATKDELTTGLTEKSDLVYVNEELDKKRNQAAKITQNDCSEDLIQQIAGTTPVNAIPADRSIAPIKTDFLLSRTVNLYDSSKASDGYINSANGSIVVDATYKVSDFIVVEPGALYSTNANAPGGYYDSNKTFVQAIAYNATKPYTVPTGLNIKYMRVSFNSPAQISSARVFAGSTLLPFEPYNPDFNILTGIKISNSNFGTPKIIDPKNCTFIRQTGELNLFNKATAIDNCYPHLNTLISDVAWASTDFISVEEGKTYTRNGGNNILCVYDINKINILEVQTSNVTIPAGGVYLRAAIFKSTIPVDQFMVVEGASKPVIYAPYVEINVLDKNIKLPVSSESSWKGKKGDSFGDSITYMNLWQPNVVSKLGLSSFSVHGVIGSRISGEAADAMWTDARINSLDIDADFYTIMGGTNDWASNVPIGSGNTMDTNTFIGAYRVLLEKLIAKFPTKHIFIMTTPYGEVPNRVGWTDQTGVINNNGFSTRNYAEACRLVAKEYGIPVVEIDAESYFNKINILQFINDEGTMRVHPNATGGKRIAEVAIGKMKQIEPA